jgi:hypothetical protein
MSTDEPADEPADDPATTPPEPQVWGPNTPADLLIVKERIYDPLGFVCSGLAPEGGREGAEYGAHKYRLNADSVRYRSAKKTPEKNGLFVTLWRRQSGGTIRPFDVGDNIDFFEITVREDEHFGHFVFPARVLREHRILSSREAEGKRAFRLYPPWSSPHSAQAARTRRWQGEHFRAIDETGPLDLDQARAWYT